MHATTVLLIRLSLGPLIVNRGDGSAEPMNAAADSGEAPEVVLAGCKNALRWLHSMENTDVACRRGFELYHCLFDRLAQSRNFSLDGAPPLASMAASHGNSSPQNFGVSRRHRDVISHDVGYTSPFGPRGYFEENILVDPSPFGPPPDRLVSHSGGIDSKQSLSSRKWPL